MHKDNSSIAFERYLVIWWPGILGFLNQINQGSDF